MSYFVYSYANISASTTESEEAMSSQAPTLYPSLRYEDAPAAMEFLKSAFGFEEREVIANEEGTIAHAELSYGPSILMLGSARDDIHGKRVGAGWLYVAV